MTKRGRAHVAPPVAGSPAVAVAGATVGTVSAPTVGTPPTPAVRPDLELEPQAGPDPVAARPEEGGVIPPATGSSPPPGAERPPEAWILTPKRLSRYLGPHRFRHGRSDGSDEIGLVNGLAVTMYGGDLLQTEVSIVAGKGKMVLTGKLGDVMQESAQAAISYVRARAPSLGLERDFYSRADIHVHLPEGAIPKDGPSAGITMCTGLVSALLRVPVRRNVAMTGEITLRGRVLPIGGLKEKILAAHRAGISVVVVPKQNAKDLRDIPKKVLKSLRVTLVEHMDEVLRIALVLPNPDEFLREPSQPVDWRVQGDRRGERDRRDDSRIPVASAAPPDPEPASPA